MFFLLRSTFWFSLVLLIIPFDAGSSDPKADRAGPLETFAAAREAIVDFSGLCERKPDVCKIGRSAINTVGVRAREAARVAYQTLDENFGEPDTKSMTGSIPEKAEPVAQRLPVQKPGLPAKADELR